VEDLAALVSIGDNFVILAQEGNDEGIKLYILQCQQASHIVQDRFTCPWGDEFDVGDHVIIGLYYQKWGIDDNGYEFLTNSQMAFFYTHLVLACKFMMLLVHDKMKGSEPIYQLPNEVLQLIKSKIDGSF